MSEGTDTEQRREPDFSAIMAEELRACRDAENRFRASSAMRAIAGEPEPGAASDWQEIELPGLALPLRAYRPRPRRETTKQPPTDLPLMAHVHGGSFVGTAVQCDWTNSHLAAMLPALVVSAEPRLLTGLLVRERRRRRLGGTPARGAVGHRPSAHGLLRRELRRPDQRPDAHPGLEDQTGAQSATAGQPRRRRDRNDVRLPVDGRVRIQSDPRPATTAALSAARRPTGNRCQCTFAPARRQPERTCPPRSWWCPPRPRSPTAAAATPSGSTWPEHLCGFPNTRARGTRSSPCPAWNHRPRLPRRRSSRSSAQRWPGDGGAMPPPP